MFHSPSNHIKKEEKMTIFSKSSRSTILMSMLAVFLGNQVSSAEWISLGKNNEKGKAKIDVTSRNKQGSVMQRADVNKLGKVELTISVPGIDVKDAVIQNETFQSVNVPGITVHASEVGKPSVPVYIFMQEVPFGSVPSVSIESVQEKVLQNINVIPTQELLPDNSTEQPPFAKDEATYSSLNLYPGNRIIKNETITMRNRQFVRLEIAIAQSRPAAKELLLAAEMKVVIELASSPSDAEKWSHANSRSFDMLFSSGASAEDFISAKIAGAPEKYMIIMDDQFDTNTELSSFVNWKSRKGYDVRIVKTSEIDPDGAPDSSEIQNFMFNLPDSEYPSYLLIIGDHTADNGVDGWFFRTSDGGYTDLYYSIRDNIGFPVPDLFYGRIPAKNNAELTLMLQKVISMDRTPPVASMYDKVTIAGQIQDNNPRDNRADRLFCETTDAIATYFEQITSGYYTCTRAVANPHGVDSNATWAASPPSYLPSILWDDTSRIGSRVWNTFIRNDSAINRISSTINNGTAIVLHRDHGEQTGWGTPSYKSNHVAALTNGDLRPLVYSLNCLTGSYHADSVNNINFMRQFLIHENGGAYGVIAATDVSYSWANDWMAHGLITGLFDDYRSFIDNASVGVNGVDWTNNLGPVGADSMHGLLEGNARKLGTNLHFGKIYMLQNFNEFEEITFRLFHVFGDPEGDIVLHTPQTQTISHPATISTGSQTVVVVTDADSVQVCLYSEALGIHLVALAQNDSAIFNINPASAGVISVTVTGFGKRPYEGQITVTGSTGNQIFGFENPSLWNFTIGSGTLSSNNSQKTEGSASMIYGGNSYREITSTSMSTSTISGETSRIALDLYIGTLQPNPWWVGEIAMLVSCPSAGIYHQSIGNVQLNSLPRGVFNTMTFNVPTNVLNVLNGNYNDFTFSIVLNTNNNSGPYYLDNMRFVP